MLENSLSDYGKHIVEFSYEDLAALLRKDSLRVSNEMLVWKVFHIWARAHQNKTAEIGDFVCYNLRYGLLLSSEIKQVFAALYELLPREMYQSVFLNLRRNYSLINNLLCSGRLVYCE